MKNNKYSVTHRGLNMVFVVFSLVVMGGAAYVMSTGNLNYKASADNTIQNVSGTLLKKGTAAFAPCTNVSTNYALSGVQGVGQSTIPATQYGCLPLTAQAAIADPFVGQKVIATGTTTAGIFYATKIIKYVACTEQCPGADGVLRNCTPPESDGTSEDSLCNFAGRVQGCGGKQYCCPVVGGKWTTDMTKCAPTPQP